MLYQLSYVGATAAMANLGESAKRKYSESCAAAQVLLSAIGISHVNHGVIRVILPFVKHAND
ncbi:MAG: hypothetical protein IJG53_01925, partial [Eggerthellaceae bacterium]|nr:hypothetical protein [Eggerthellaceae bacterium]